MVMVVAFFILIQKVRATQDREQCREPYGVWVMWSAQDKLDFHLGAVRIKSESRKERFVWKAKLLFRLYVFFFCFLVWEVV